MKTLKLGIVMMFAANILLLGMAASRATGKPDPAVPAPAQALRAVPDIVLRSELSEAPAPVATPACFTIGPFESGQTAEAISMLLTDNGYSSQARETEAFVDRGYWVYLPPFESERAARQALDDLYRAGLEDIALIRSGDWERSVSLGYFISQANALARRQEAAELGFDAEMRIQREDEPRYWVDYLQAPGERATAKSLLADLVPIELHRDVACAQEVAMPMEALPEGV